MSRLSSRARLSETPNLHQLPTGGVCRSGFHVFVPRLFVRNKQVGPRAAVGLHSGNSTGNSVVLEMNGERASSVGSSAHCGGIDDNAWH